jgi:hypothetical protein
MGTFMWPRWTCTIWKIKPGVDDLDDEVMLGGIQSDDEWTAVLVADFDQHK